MSSANNSSCNRHITEQQSQRGNFKIFNIYRPQRSWGKVMFLHVSVILLTRGGVCLSACWDSRPPWEQTPPPRSRPPWEQTPPPPVHAGRYGQQAGGMHPTGMQSCYWPQRSCAQGNIFAPVCHSVHRGGVQYPSMHRLPLEQTPPPQSRHHTPGVTPLGADTPPRADTTSLEQTPPGSRHPTPGSRLRHTVNERPVRILLECILV